VRLFILVLFQSNLLFGHGALDEQISEATTQISATPNDPKLYLHRANLHQSHRDPEAALRDFIQATKIEPPYPPAFLKLACFHRKADQPDLAKKALATYFKIQDQHTPLAFREKALLSSPADSIAPWQRYLEATSEPVLHDYQLAAAAALEANNHKASQKFILTGLDLFPKSIKLHQYRAHTLLANQDVRGAQDAFQTLSLLYPNLLVKLKYDESIIWKKHQHPDQESKALTSALKAYQQLPSRLRQNRDFKALAIKIQASLRK